MSRQDQFDRIIASLYEAALDDRLWHRTSILIDEACGFTGTHLCLVGGATQGDAKWLFDKAYWRGESREEQGRDYAENYFPGDERIPRLIALQDRRIVHVADLYTDRQLRTSPTYNELLRRAGAQDGLNIRMDGPDGIHIVWALADPVGRDGWNSEQLEMIERLLPHIRQFVRIRHTLIGAQALSTAFSGVIHSTMVAVLCLDWRGMIVQANSRACAILRQRDGLLDRGGFLCARLPADNLRLGRLLARVLPRSGGQPAGGSMTVGRAQRGGPLPRLALHVTPVEVRDAGFGVGHVVALVLIVDPAAKPCIAPEHVAATLGLTRAESEVAVALAQGATMRAIATATHRSDNTVRELVKRIHSRLGISRRADLVRMVLTLGGSPAGG